MRSLRGLLAGALCLLLSAGPAPNALAAPPRLSASLARKIDTHVEDALRRFSAPGAVVLVIRNDQPVFARAYGAQDMAGRVPVRRDTFFEIGSITKQFTAASILQLQEAGKLRIDERLSRYLPDAPHADEVTLRQLLTHTSGLHDYLDGPRELMDQIVPKPISYDELIARVASRPLDFPPGSRWSYSNTGYLLLGRVIEAVSGETYSDYLQHHIFAPLHMRNTYTTAEERQLPNMAAGHRHAGRALEHAPIIHPSWSGAAGFLIATTAELAKWDEALSSGKVISIDSYRQMTTPFETTENGSAGYGLGLFVDSAYGQPRIGHTGGSWGFTTADEYFPRQGVRIIAFTNLGDETPEVGEALTNILFADLFPAIAAEAERAAPGEDAQVTQLTRDAFRELQMGRDYAGFSPRLRERLAAGMGGDFVTRLGPYGAPTAVTFKGTRRKAADNWYDYVIQFGPGVYLPFAVRIGADGTVAGFSLG